MKYFKVNGELILSISLVISGLLITYFSLELGFGSFKSPGSGLFPFFCGIMLTFFSISLILPRTLRKKREGDAVFHTGEIVRIFSISFLLVSWLILAHYFGYVLATAICTYTIAKLMGLQGWIKPLLLSVGTAGFCYLLFDYFLYLDLPRGMFS